MNDNVADDVITIVVAIIVIMIIIIFVGFAIRDRNVQDAECHARGGVLVNGVGGYVCVATPEQAR